MAAEPKITIKLLSIADTSGVQQMTAATKAQTTATQQATTAARSNAEVIRRQDEAMGKAGKTTGNFAQAMLQGSRGVQDFAAAGIPGMVNNVEGLATALGLGASAAGGFTLAFVAIEVLMKNWDTWFGEEKAKQAADFWSAMSPDEAQMTRLRKANEALENQAKNLERIAEIRKADIQTQRDEDELLAKKAALWKDIVPTAKERGDLPPLPGTEPDSPEMKEAKRKAAEKEAETKAKVGTFQGLDAATEAQRKRVEDMNRIATLPEKVKLANDADNEAIKGLNLRFNQGGQAESPGDYAKLERLREQMRQREADMRSQINAVPGLTDGLTGDPEKDKQALQARAAQEREQLAQLEARRLQAARDAEAAARAQAQAEQGVTNQAGFETEKRAAAAFKEGSLPPAPGQFAGADARGGIDTAMASMAADAAEAQRQSAAIAAELQRIGNMRVQPLTELSGSLQNFAAGISAEQSSVRGAIAALQQTVNQLRVTPP